MLRDAVFLLSERVGAEGEPTVRSCRSWFPSWALTRRPENCPSYLFVNSNMIQRIQIVIYFFLKVELQVKIPAVQEQKDF